MFNGCLNIYKGTKNIGLLAKHMLKKYFKKKKSVALGFKKALVCLLRQSCLSCMFVFFFFKSTLKIQANGFLTFFPVHIILGESTSDNL